MPPPPPEDTRTGIIRRAPTGSIPAQHDPRTTHIAAPAEAPTGLIPAPPTGIIAAAAAAAAQTAQPSSPSGRSAVAACAVAMLSGWAVTVVGTDLISGWWRTDRLFCLGVGFLMFVFAATTISGVITVLLRRAVGPYLIATGAAVALLTFSAVFIAGASVPWPIYLIPVLPVASVLLAFLPATRRWTRVR